MVPEASLRPGDAVTILARRSLGGIVEKKKSPQGKKDLKSSEDPAFDNWLDNKLRSAYSSVLDEPIPEDLIKLLHQKLKD